jgi:hypothetical protein
MKDNPFGALSRRGRQNSIGEIMMKKVAATTLFLLAASVAAQAENLTDDALRERIVDKTVHLRTPFGIELPLQYRANGEVSGNITGFSMASMFAPSETGRWWIEGENLCQQWPTWYDGETFCFTIRDTGPSTISWTRNDGMNGTARIEG